MSTVRTARTLHGVCLTNSNKHEWQREYGQFGNIKKKVIYSVNLVRDLFYMVRITHPTPLTTDIMYESTYFM